MRSEAEWTVDQWTDFVRVGQILTGQKWVFARTMAYNPHWYTLRRTWARPDDEFTLAIEVIRDFGYPQRFGKRDWTCLDLNDHFYWTHDYSTIGSYAESGQEWVDNGSWAIHKAGNKAKAHWGCCFLINRKPGSGQALAVPYDLVGSTYDTRLMMEPTTRYDRLFELIGPVQGWVLDVGCGSGAALPYVLSHEFYQGIDPSRQMLELFKQRWPGVPVTLTRLASFAPLKVLRYDLVLALGGVGSYLTDRELRRIPLLLAPGGRAAVMFYTTQQPLHAEPVRLWQDGLFPGQVYEVAGQVLCLYERGPDAGGPVD